MQGTLPTGWNKHIIIMIIMRSLWQPLFAEVCVLLCCHAVQPSQVSDFGLRYGIQIGQAFGYDFGIGIIRDICFVSFVIV